MESHYYKDAVELLKRLISTQSFSREEDKTASIIEDFFNKKGIETSRSDNNVWVKNRHFDPAKRTLLLNSHHDTVKPNTSWTFDPFSPVEKEGKLFGLGSNDAGGCLVSLAATFLNFYEHKNLIFNVIFAATAEEEISGQKGIASVIPLLPEIDFAIVGEPTEMNLAVAEKGLMVLDCTSFGKSGHAAREEGENAIYKAMDDIDWFRGYNFPVTSQWLGPVKMQVTLIQAGTQHNVVPDQCKFTVDVRTTDAYSNEEVLAIIKENVYAEVKERSLRLQPSSISIEHPFIQAGITLGMKTYGSPTLSDQALLKVPSVKIGPGKSERSHTADEFIELKEIKTGIQIYVKWLEGIIANF